ncbi:hypothetical protein [Roseibium sp. M-1]
MSDFQEARAQDPAAPDQNDTPKKSARSLGTSTMVTIYICAAIGGTIAAIADLVQKEQASAVLKMTTISARHLNLAVQPLYIFAAIVVLGVLLCFVFQPVNRRAGFAVGAGVIAAIMTVTPYQPLQSGKPAEAAGGTSSLLNGSLQVASSDAGVFLLAGNSVDVAMIPIRNDLAIPVEVKVSFHDRNGNQAYQQVQAIAAGGTGLFEFTALSDSGRINGEVFLEVGGERSSYVETAGTAPYRSPALLLTQAVPAFAQAQVDRQALQSFNTRTATASRPASDTEIRQIYNKPSGFFNQLQQKLLTPRKW